MTCRTSIQTTGIAYADFASHIVRDGQGAIEQENA